MTTARTCGHKPLIDYVAEAAATADIVMSICTGALILASAGLLAGRTATTHWAYTDILQLLGGQPVRARPFGPIDWDPEIGETIRAIFRGPLDEVVAAHPYLDRSGRV